jgi:protein-S-isoprenylcysteine O-methyltransferase Ste14
VLRTRIRYADTQLRYLLDPIRRASDELGRNPRSTHGLEIFVHCVDRASVSSRPGQIRAYVIQGAQSAGWPTLAVIYVVQGDDLSSFTKRSSRRQDSIKQGTYSSEGRCPRLSFARVATGAIIVLRARAHDSLMAKAFGGLLFLLLVMAALLFIPAGTLHYWQAWTFLAVYFASALAITLYLMKEDPKLLKRRMSGGPMAEKEPTQKIIMLFASLAFLCLIIIPALDHRFAWSHMQSYVSLAGDVLVVLGWFAIFLVFKENTFASATIELAPDHKVISTGPYALVRHPMYAGALVMLLGIPIALGSWGGLLVIVAIMPALIWRLIDEEKFLSRKLPGYVEYQKKVPYRLIPLVW